MRKDHTDETYERVFPDLSDEVLCELGQAENAELHLTAVTSSPATQPQALGLLAPAVAADIQPSSGPESLPDNPQPAPLKSRYRRQASAPPAEITPTKLRPRITPSKKYGSDVSERANARRTQPPKSTSPSPPIPSQILAISLASSMPLPSDLSPANIATNDDPFQNSNVHPPTLNHGPYRYGNQYPPQQMVPPYTASYSQMHGFLPMNTSQYGGQYDHQHDLHSPYGDVPNYGPLPSMPGMQHGPVPGYPPPHFQQPSNFHYFGPGVPGERPYFSASRESTLAPRDTTPSLPPQADGQSYVASNSVHPSGSKVPSNVSSNQKPSTIETPSAPATAIQSEKLPNPTPKVSPITPTTSGVENIPASGIPGHEFTKIFNNEYFAPLRLPPGPKDAPILKVSPPTPIPSVNPKRSEHSLSTSGDLRLPPGPNDAPLLKASLPTPIPSITPKRSLPTGADTPTNYRLLLDDDSPTIGRLSKGKEDALIAGLGSLDRLVKEIAVSSGLSVTQIVERWNGGTPHSLNSWNIYQAYIKQNLDREIGRLITTKKSKGLS